MTAFGALFVFGRIDGPTFGCYGEASSDVEKIVQAIARREAARHWRDMGATDEAAARAVLIRRARKRIGVEIVRGYAWMKMAVMDRWLSGSQQGRSAAQRRSSARREYRERREAYHRYNRPGAHHV